jgi:hypothetical protein
MRTRFVTVFVLCALVAGRAPAADRIIGAVSPRGGAVLVKHVAIPAGTVVSGITFTSNDLRTVFPKVALLRGPATRLSDAETLREVTDVRAETSHHLWVSFSSLHLDVPTDLLVAITLPASAGVRGLRDGEGVLATQLPAPAHGYFAASGDADLAPMDVDYAIELVFGQEPAAKAGRLDPEPEQSRVTTFLRAGAPNPTSGATLITFGLERGAPAALAVYDVAGRHVRTLVRGELAAGTHVRAWDGRSEQGHPVAAGLYIVRLTAADKVLTEKLVLAK